MLTVLPGSTVCVPVHHHPRFAGRRARGRTAAARAEPDQAGGASAHAARERHQVEGAGDFGLLFGRLHHPLEDEHTLIITATDAYNKSFGCGNGRNLTWFGKAYFDDDLRRPARFPTRSGSRARKWPSASASAGSPRPTRRCTSARRCARSCAAWRRAWRRAGQSRRRPDPANEA